MADTEKLQESWESEHNQKLDQHENSSKSLTVQLRESLTESCASEKASIEDITTEKCAREKADLQTELRTKLKSITRKAM